MQRQKLDFNSHAKLFIDWFDHEYDSSYEHENRLSSSLLSLSFIFVHNGTFTSFYTSGSFTPTHYDVSFSKVISWCDRFPDRLDSLRKKRSPNPFSGKDIVQLLIGNIRANYAHKSEQVFEFCESY